MECLRCMLYERAQLMSVLSAGSWWLLGCIQARQIRPNSGGVAEVHPRFDKGGLQQFFTFYALKIELFGVFTLSD